MKSKGKAKLPSASSRIFEKIVSKLPIIDRSELCAALALLAITTILFENVLNTIIMEQQSAKHS
jgi:hypothetical protein